MYKLTAFYFSVLPFYRGEFQKRALSKYGFLVQWIHTLQEWNLFHFQWMSIQRRILKRKLCSRVILGLFKIVFIEYLVSFFSNFSVLVYVVSSSWKIPVQLLSARTTLTFKIPDIQATMEKPIRCLTLSTSALMTFVGYDWISRRSIRWPQPIQLKKQMDQLPMPVMILWLSRLLLVNLFLNFVEI